VAAERGRVGVVDPTGRLINAGWLSEADDGRKVVFSSASSDVKICLPTGESGTNDDLLARIVPMTPEHDRRWSLIHTCREFPWNVVSNEMLEGVLEVLRGSGFMKVSRKRVSRRAPR